MQERKTISLNKKFYKKETVLAIKEKFKDIAELDILENTERYVVLLKKKKAFEDRILEQFANHCLAEGKQ